MMKTLMICFVYNERKYIEFTLNYYKKMGCDVYVLDNYSDDGTYEWLIENNIPCHRVDTKNGFDIRILSAEVTSTVHKIKPDWVILGAADLYHITKTPISQYVEWIDSMGFNQLTLPCIDGINVEETYNVPIPLHHNFALYHTKLTLISKYIEGFYCLGDRLYVKNPNPYISSEGVTINYGHCKPNEEREAKRLRTQKAWENGMNGGWNGHYEQAKKRNWKPSDTWNIFDLRESIYYEYIKIIRELNN